MTRKQVKRKRRNQNMESTEMTGKHVKRRRNNQNMESIEMTGKQVKRKRNNQNMESMDRISELPDHIIHHILSHLRSMNDMARVSILSKRWREIWYSFSNLIFDERKFAAGLRGLDDRDHKKSLFLKHVYNSLHRHLERNMPIQKMLLHMISCDSEDVPHINHWLNVAIKENVKELDLSLDMKKGIKYYTLPQTILSAESLTRLRLCGCKLETCNNIIFPCLQKLYLRKMELNECIIQNLISSCIFIEDLRLVRCSGLKELKISNLVQLNRVEIYHCNQLEKIELHCANLHTFWFCCKKSTPCKVNLAGCKPLKRLTLEHPQVTDEFYENQLSNFPFLESLDLGIPNNLDHITISNPQLQRLVLRGCRKLAFACVYTPNLLSFEYLGRKMPRIDIHPFILRDAKLSFKPKLNAVPKFEDQVYFPMLRDFIKQFDSKGFKLIVRSKKSIIIHENLDEVLLPPLTDLNIEIIKSSVCLEDFLDSLLRRWHPETLSIISPLDSKFPGLAYEKVKNKDEDPSCCKYITSNNKCWRHFLKEAKVEDFGDVEDERKFAWLLFVMSKQRTLSCHLTSTNLRLYWNNFQHGEN